MIIKSDSVMAVTDGLVEVERKFYIDLTEGGEDVAVAAARLGNLPLKEAAFGVGCANTGMAIRVAAGHGGFVGGDDFVSGAVLSDGGGVDPDDAVAEAADLIELMADQDDGAAGAGHVSHFAQALLLEIDVADGEDFIDEENLRLQVRGDGEGQADVHP